MKIRVYERVIRFVPKTYMVKVEQLLLSAGIKVSPQRWVGFFFLFSFFLSLGVFVDSVLFNFEPKLMLILSFALFIGINVVSHVVLILAVDKRIKFIEHMFPSALILMASNIKSGIIPAQAMLVSARKEFGPLEEEMRMTSNEIIGGKSFEEALSAMGKRVNSEVLTRTFNLINEGSKAGSEIATLLEGLAEDMKHTELVKEELKASVKMYVIFIFIAAGVVAPMLFAISIFLVEMITEFGSVEVPEIASAGVPMITLTIGTISSEFLTFFAVCSITITSFFGSLIIGLIERGEEKKGIKYIPILLILGIVIFFVSSIIVDTLFSTISIM